MQNFIPTVFTVGILYLFKYFFPEAVYAGPVYTKAVFYKSVYASAALFHFIKGSVKIGRICHKGAPYAFSSLLIAAQLQDMGIYPVSKGHSGLVCEHIVGNYILHIKAQHILNKHRRHTTAVFSGCAMPEDGPVRLLHYPAQNPGKLLSRPVLNDHLPVYGTHIGQIVFQKGFFRFLLPAYSNGLL